MYIDLEGDHPRQVIEGDILVNEFIRHLIGLPDDRDQVNDHLLPDENRKKKGILNELYPWRFRWPNCIVPYAFSSFVGKKNILSTHTLCN